MPPPLPLMTPFSTAQRRAGPPSRPPPGRWTVRSLPPAAARFRHRLSDPETQRLLLHRIDSEYRHGRSGVIALAGEDDGTEARTISDAKQVNRIKGELVVSPPKTQNSVRTPAIPQQAVELLIEEHKKHPGNSYMFPAQKPERCMIRTPSAEHTIKS